MQHCAWVLTKREGGPLRQPRGGWTPASSGLSYVPNNKKAVTGEEAEKCFALDWHESDKSHSFEHTRILESLTVATATEEIVASLDDSSVADLVKLLDT